MAAPIDAVGQMSNSRVLTIRRVVAYTVLTIFAVLSLYPFVLLLINMTRENYDIRSGFKVIPGTYLIKNFKTVYNKNDWMAMAGLKNSLIISSLCAVFSTYFSALTAYGIHVYDFKLKKFLFGFILMIMMVPTQVSAIGFVNMINGWAQGIKSMNPSSPSKFAEMLPMLSLILPSIAAPAVFFFMKQYMDSSLPLDIVEAARIDGCGEFKTFNSLILPIMKPAMAVQGIFVFVSSWNNYFVPNLIISKKEYWTLPLVIANIKGQDMATMDMGAVYMATGIAIVPVVIVYLILSKFIIRGIALGAVKG
jgi:multiple sugar transport system permease protein